MHSGLFFSHLSRPFPSLLRGPGILKSHGNGRSGGSFGRAVRCVFVVSVVSYESPRPLDALTIQLLCKKTDKNLKILIFFIANRGNSGGLKKSLKNKKHEITLSRPHQNNVFPGFLGFWRSLLGVNNSFHVFEENQIRRLGGRQSIIFSRIFTLLTKIMFFLSDLMKRRTVDTF